MKAHKWIIVYIFYVNIFHYSLNKFDYYLKRYDKLVKISATWEMKDLRPL